MSRPKRVVFEDFKNYNLLHTKKVKQYSGTEITALYPIKETKFFYKSIEVWSHCVSSFKKKKKNFNLNVNIPVLNDENTKLFLNKHYWKDWVSKQLNSNSSVMIETIDLLNNIDQA